VAGSEALWIAWTTGLEMDISAPGKVMARLDRDLRGSSVPSNDNAVAKMRLMSILNQESAAREWLGTQRNIKPEDRQLIESEVSEMVLIASIIRSGESKTPDWSKLEPLLARDPNHPMWSRLAVALWAAPPKPENEAARIWVQKRLDEGTSADTILRYSILASSSKYNTTGTKAEDSKVLRGLYRKLLATQPDDVIALNNLSMLIYKYEPDHLDEALQYASRAAKLAPRVPAVRDTVGEILARQGRWDEALPILESCISDLPEEWNLHNTLAQIYDKKGLKDRAAAHKSALERIKRPLDAANYDKLPQPKAVIPLRNPTPVGS
jgi:tetratricopeptide (TPR) repeat protein